MPTIFHCHAPKNTKLNITAKITNKQSTQIFIFGNSMPVTWLTATGNPSPGIVIEPHLTSQAMPKPKIVHPNTCATIFCGKSVGANQAVSAMLRSMREPKTKPTKS